MKDDTGVALYGKAGELGMPVGVMCFKGFGRHVKEIEALLLSSPQTKVCCVCCTISLWCILCAEYDIVLSFFSLAFC